MKLNVDKEADALYLHLDDSPIVESEEVSPDEVLDYNDSNEVVGVELLHPLQAIIQPQSLRVAVRDNLAFRYEMRWSLFDNRGEYLK